MKYPDDKVTQDIETTTVFEASAENISLLQAWSCNSNTESQDL